MSKKVHVEVSLPGGPGIASWDTDEEGNHTPSPFSVEGQMENARQWGRAKRQRRQKKLAQELAETLPVLAAYEVKLRRSFNHWDKTRGRVARIERELNTLSMLEAAEELPK